MSFVVWLLALAAISKTLQRLAFSEVKSPIGRAFGIAVGIAISIALSSASGFLAGLFSDGLSDGVLLTESCALVAVGIAAWMAAPALRHDYYDLGHDKPSPPRTALILLSLTAALVLIAAAAQIPGYYAARPHGSPDGWAIWNVRARFLALSPFDWTRGFREAGFGNPDYPLLLPVLVARLWNGLATTSTLVPLSVGLGYLILSISVAGLGVAWLSGIPAGLATVIVLASTQSLIFESAAQCADVPLAFYYLCTCALLICSDRALPRNTALALAGATATAAMWTKNEGILFFGVCLVSLYGVSQLMDNRREAIHNARAFLVGAAPIGLVAALFKLRYAPAPKIVADQSADGFFATLFDASRHASTLSAYGAEIWSSFGLCLMAILAWLILKPKNGEARPMGIGARAALLTLFLSLLGYYTVHTTTAFAFEWHLETSLDRLLLHFWPATVLVLMSGLTSEDPY